MAEPRTDDRDPMCTPCRGTGKVISNLGGERHERECPWCGGTGRWRPEGIGREREAPEAE
jgi:DnaJ-class molecular chaperone